MAKVQHFLLVFDRSKDELLEQYDFGSNGEEATEAYSQIEQKFADNAAIDVVLVGSDSIETVKITHANYFSGKSRNLMENALNLYAATA